MAGFAEYYAQALERNKALAQPKAPRRTVSPPASDVGGYGFAGNGSADKPQDPLSFIVDILSRPLYGVTEQFDERGFPTCLHEAIARVTSGTAGFHLSFDLDAVDPRYAPGTGTPVPGGLTYREAHFACEAAAESGHLLAMDMVELNPTLDEHNRTGKLAVELILSALGKTIL